MFALFRGRFIRRTLDEAAQPVYSFRGAMRNSISRCSRAAVAPLICVFDRLPGAARDAKPENHWDIHEEKGKEGKGRKLRRRFRVGRSGSVGFNYTRSRIWSCSKRPSYSCACKQTIVLDRSTCAITIGRKDIIGPYPSRRMPGVRGESLGQGSAEGPRP